MNISINKVAIIGCSGAGKSTLAIKIAQKFALPVYHLDQYAHVANSNWERVSDAELIENHNGIIQNEFWVIDGNYSICMLERFAAADVIIWLDFNPIYALFRFIKRVFVKDSMRAGGLPGATTQFQFSMCKHILFTYPKNRKKYRSLLNKFPGATVWVVVNQQELNDLYAKLGISA